MSDTYPVTAVNRAKRLHERAAYDHATIHALLDASMMCHIAYVVEGRPFCTPTLFWREGTKLYWHGSSASRMLRSQSEGEPVCLTVAHLDSLVLARSAFNHSVDYRAVMAFGHAKLIEDEAEKLRGIRAMVDRFYPGRTDLLRAPTAQEIKATRFIGMEIEQASAKIRAKGIGDEEEDYALPIYAERIPVHTVLGAPEPCARLAPGVARPEGIAGYREGRRLDETVAEAHAATFRAE